MAPLRLDVNPCVARAFHPHSTRFLEINFKKGEENNDR